MEFDLLHIINGLILAALIHAARSLNKVATTVEVHEFRLNMLDGGSQNGGK